MEYDIHLFGKTGPDSTHDASVVFSKLTAVLNAEHYSVEGAKIVYGNYAVNIPFSAEPVGVPDPVSDPDRGVPAPRAEEPIPVVSPEPSTDAVVAKDPDPAAPAAPAVTSTSITTADLKPLLFELRDLATIKAVQKAYAEHGHGAKTLKGLDAKYYQEMYDAVLAAIEDAKKNPPKEEKEGEEDAE